MSTELTAIAALAGILTFAVLIDRGAPNTLESIAFAIERVADLMVTALRRGAAALRRRHRAIELENQARLRSVQLGRSVETVVNSRSSSAAA